MRHIYQQRLRSVGKTSRHGSPDGALPPSAAEGTTERVLRDDRRQVRGVQTFKAWALADRRNQIDAVYGTSGPEADSSTEVVSVKARGGKKKRMIKINA